MNERPRHHHESVASDTAKANAKEMVRLFTVRQQLSRFAIEQTPPQPIIEPEVQEEQ